jgi:hypothetical protein
MQGIWGRRVLAVVLAALMASGFSGCFVWNSFKWSSTKVEAGKSTKALIGMTSALGSPPADRDFPFVLVGLQDPTQLSLGSTRSWDTKGKFGGPLPLFSDGALRTAALGADGCKLAGQPLSQIDNVSSWAALRTQKKVDDKDRAGTIATAKIAIKADQGATQNQEFVYFLGGGWADDGDDNPESDEVGCGGGTVTTLAIKG